MWSGPAMGQPSSVQRRLVILENTGQRVSVLVTVTSLTGITLLEAEALALFPP